MKSILRSILAMGLAATLGAAPVSAADTPEYMLAIIDAGGPNVSDGTVGKYAGYLNALEPKCTEARMSIADFTVAGVQKVRERAGKSMTHLLFLQALDEAIPSSMAAQGGTSCAQIAAAIVILIK